MKELAGMKIKVTLTEQSIENNLQKVKDMILCDKIKLKNIKRSLRILHKAFYIMAFRASRNKHTCNEYIDNLKILQNDIYACNDNNIKGKLINLFADYIRFCPYNGDEVFENYKRHIDEKILSNLSISKLNNEKEALQDDGNYNIYFCYG